MLCSVLVYGVFGVMRHFISNHKWSSIVSCFRRVPFMLMHFVRFFIFILFLVYFAVLEKKWSWCLQYAQLSKYVYVGFEPFIYLFLSLFVFIVSRRRLLTNRLCLSYKRWNELQIQILSHIEQDNTINPNEWTARVKIVR